MSIGVIFFKKKYMLLRRLWTYDLCNKSWHLILIGQLLLEAPDDIYSFQFSPSDPNIICGGCYNGQVVLWDISAHADRLKQPRGGNRNKKSNVLVSDELISYKMMSVFVHYCTHW